MIKVDHPTALLDVRGITKSFSGVQALRGVDLEILPGEVHCVLGQNGAGKSTLIKTLAGVHRPDAGTITWQGETVDISTPEAAIELGIATMYQELDVVDGLTIAENIFLGHELARGGFTRRSEAFRRTRELLARLGHASLSPNADVGQLSAANKQIVSMARALSHDIKLIIMDEPSAVLDTEEVKNLFGVVKELTSEGIAVVYITHRLEEIRQIGDRITVLKDGRSMATGLAVADTPTAELIRLMTGRSVENVFPPAVPVPDDSPTVLEVEGLALDGVFRDVSFSVRAGEVIGLAGLVGSGRSEILETVYGARKSTAGTVRVGGKALRRGSVVAAVAAGIGLSPEERKSQGLVLDEPIFVNVTLSSMSRFAKAGFLDERAERKVAREQIEALELRPADPDRAAITLSGGNQQKILLARWLVHGTRVLLLDEPTRGVDVGARAEIYALIRRLAAAGNAVVVVSSEIPEVLGLADSVLVISDGRVIQTLPSSQIDEHGVLDLVMKGTARVSEQNAGVTVAPQPTPPETRSGGDKPKSGIQRVLSGSVGRNLGLVVALLLIVVVGAITAPDTFTSLNNLLTILRQASIIGVISIGMTLVIIAGGIDLSVGSVMGLASVVATIAVVQNFSESTHWIVMVVVALAVGLAAGLINGVVIAYGKVVAFMATLAMLVAARGLAEILAERRTLQVGDRSFITFMNGDILGVDILIWIFAIVSVLGWVLLNRTTFGRRTIAIGGNREAARLAGINVKRHIMWLYALAGLGAGIAAVMILGRTTAGTSTHGQLYELDAIAAVVVGGTLLVGGRGTITGTVFGVLIFATLSNVFVQNNLTSSVQAVAKGIIIVVAVLLQQRFRQAGGKIVLTQAVISLMWMPKPDDLRQLTGDFCRKS